MNLYQKKVNLLERGLLVIGHVSILDTMDLYFVALYVQREIITMENRHCLHMVNEQNVCQCLRNTCIRAIEWKANVWSKCDNSKTHMLSLPHS